MNVQKMTLDRFLVSPKVMKDFAGVRGRVRLAVEASPRSVTFSQAKRQVRMFHTPALKK